MADNFIGKEFGLKIKRGITISLKSMKRMEKY